MLKRIGFALLCISIPMISSAQSAPSTADGLFGQYFLNMVKPCGTNTQVVTGFNKTTGNFGHIICTNITDILNNIDGIITIGKNVTPIPGAMVTIKGPVATDHIVSDMDHSGTLVTKEYLEKTLEKKVPRIEVGIFSSAGRPGSNHYVAFKKPFNSTPLVIVQPSGMWYNDGCRGDGWNFDTNPRNINNRGFTVNMPNTGRCGGYMHNYSVTYVAIENIENIVAIAPPSVSLPEYSTDVSLERKGVTDFRSNIFLRACGSEIRLGRSSDCSYKYCSGRWGEETCWSRDHYWFEGIDFTVIIAMPNQATESLVPIATTDNREVKKVVLTVVERESGDWPEIGTRYVFCDPNVVKDETCRSFDTLHEVFNAHRNILRLKVFYDYSSGTIKLQYNGIDHSPGNGGVNLVAETFY